MTTARRRSTLVLLAVSSILAVTWVRALWPRPSAWASTRWPHPEELDSLGRYLAPADPAPEVDDYASYLPANIPAANADPPPAGAEPALPPAPSARLEPGTWRLGAILLSDAHRLAVIDDRVTRPGDRLEHGARLVAVEEDHVIIEEPNGVRHTLRSGPGEGGA